MKVYILVQQSETEECLKKVRQYGIKRLSAIAINPELLRRIVEHLEQFESGECDEKITRN